MRLDCKVIEDLLPLYLDGVCSEQSKKMVEEHLEECGKCRKLVEEEQTFQGLHVEPEEREADRIIKKGFRKIRSRWWISVASILIIVPILFLGWNQYHDRGIHYTNMKEYHTGRAFMEHLQEGEYEKAFEYIDVESMKRRWQRDFGFEAQDLTNMRKDGLLVFCKYAKEVEELGGIESYKYKGISMGSHGENGTPTYRLQFEIIYIGRKQMLHIDVSEDGVESIGADGSYLTDPLAKLAAWGEYLWQDYSGCYYDPDLKRYVYTDEEKAKVTQ